MAVLRRSIFVLTYWIPDHDDPDSPRQWIISSDLRSHPPVVNRYLDTKSEGVEWLRNYQGDGAIGSVVLNQRTKPGEEYVVDRVYNYDNDATHARAGITVVPVRSSGMFGDGTRTIDWLVSYGTPDQMGALGGTILARKTKKDALPEAKRIGRKLDLPVYVYAQSNADSPGAGPVESPQKRIEV